MLPHPWSRWLAAALLGACLTVRPAVAQEAPPPFPAYEAPVVASDDEVQDAALTSGPVHEAFAAPVTLQAQAGLLAPSAPPAAIPEVPPDSRPAGKGYLWIPGYWSWDDGRQTYLWVSACWRLAPPSMYWVPGYWSATAAGYEWEPGFWAPTAEQELVYLPAPPDVGDLQPVGVAPTPECAWVPPCHYWQRDHYVRRAGYWLPPQENWLWIPSHFQRTPHGYVFCPGHWDHALERRGVLFAPVNFTRVELARAHFGFTPNIVVDLRVLSAHLFVHARYSHYYFGDYYDTAYLKIGIYPSFQSERLQVWYDPVFVYHRWQNSHSNPHWEDQERTLYAARNADHSLRPTHTYREQETRYASHADEGHHGQPMARPLVVVVGAKNSTMEFQSVSESAREHYVQKAGQVHQWGDDRRQWETGPGSHPATGNHPEEHAAPHAQAPAPTPRVEPTRTEPARTGPDTTHGKRGSEPRAAPVAVAPTPAEPVVDRGTRTGGHQPPAATAGPPLVTPVVPPLVTPVVVEPVHSVPVVVTPVRTTPVVVEPVRTVPVVVTPAPTAPARSSPPANTRKWPGATEPVHTETIRAAPIAVTPAPAAPVAVTPAPAAPVAVTPVPATPVAVTPAHVAPVAVTPTPAAPVAVTPAHVAPVAITPAPAKPVVVTPAPAAPVAVTPAPTTPPPAPAAPSDDASSHGRGGRGAAFTPPADLPSAAPVHVKVTAPPLAGEDTAHSLPNRPTEERKVRDHGDATDSGSSGDSNNGSNGNERRHGK